jgi:predicted AlkP superfamily pyrophosphatase or phosphodiesterase
MTSQVQELLDGARAGRWILPSPKQPNPVSLVRAIADICGATNGFNDPVADSFRNLIGEPEHLVFVIADGFGMNFVNSLDKDSFSRSNLAIECRAVFPSSTGPNLFTYGRGQWPGQHGKLGWWVHLPVLGERASLFPWQRTRDGKDLTELGLDGASVFPGEAFVVSFGRDVANFIPDDLAGSVPTRALHGPDSINQYSGLSNAVDLVVERIDSADEPTYSHIYWPKIDSAAHGGGTTHEKTLGRVSELDSQMQRLRELLPSNATLVITADHGHADAPRHLKFRIDPSDEMSQMLETEPAGESRILYFRVKDGENKRFAELFRKRYGEYLFLFSFDEMVELELLGPDGISDVTKERLGDFLAVAKGACSIEFCAEGQERMLLLESTHGGLTPDEMLVPVIIA